MKLEIQEISSEDQTIKITWHLVKARKCFHLESKEQSSSAMNDYSSKSDKYGAIPLPVPIKMIFLWYTAVSAGAVIGQEIWILG